MACRAWLRCSRRSPAGREGVFSRGRGADAAATVRSGALATHAVRFGGVATRKVRPGTLATGAARPGTVATHGGVPVLDARAWRRAALAPPRGSLASGKA